MTKNRFFSEQMLRLRNLVDRFSLEIPIYQQLKFSPILAQLIVIRRCNIVCGYCNEFDTTSEPVPANILFQRIEKLRQLGTVSLEFSGGEPLLNPSIFDAVSLATKKNFLTRMMITNAYLLDSDKIKKLNDAGLTHMQISIDGVNPNETTIKVLKPLRQKLENLAKLREFNVTINSVIGAAPAEEAEEVFNFAEDIGFTPRVLVVHNEKGQMKLSEKDMALYQLLRKKINNSKIKKNYTDKLLAGEEAPFKCRGGSRYLYVDEFGVVHYCSQTMKDYGKPLELFTLNDLINNFNTPHPCTNFCTIGCARNNSSLDEWRK